MTSDITYVGHILEAVRRIREYTSDGEEEFLRDPRTQDAVLRNLQVLGEAAKKISPRFVDRYPAVPWRSMAGLRDRVVHDYFGVSLAIVWDVIVNHLPHVDSALAALAREEVSLAEDAADLESLDQRKLEPTVDFEKSIRVSRRKKPATRPPTRPGGRRKR